MAGLAEPLTPLLQVCGLGARRLLASVGAGAELASLGNVEGTVILPGTLHVLEPLLAHVLPKAKPRCCSSR